MWGACPHCRKYEDILNLGRDYWSVCHTHKTKWWIGSNLFSSWRNETEDDWTQNKYRLAEYVQVEPVFPKGPPYEAA